MLFVGPLKLVALYRIITLKRSPCYGVFIQQILLKKPQTHWSSGCPYISGSNLVKRSGLEHQAIAVGVSEALPACLV